MRDDPEVVLTRHFFASLFDFGFLSDDGAEALKRAMLGSLAVALAIGGLLVRVFMAKYSELSAEPFDVYQQAVMADHAFLMAVPMWFVAAAIGLVGESLFPNQTDFRILMVEPLSRPTIFGAKLAALLLFGGLFVAGTHLALAPLAALTMLGMFKTGSFTMTAAAFAVSSALASLFAALAIVGVHGVLVLFAPRARLVAFSSAGTGARRSERSCSLCPSSSGSRPPTARSGRTPGGSGWRRLRGSWGWSAGLPAMPAFRRLPRLPRSAR